MLQEPAVPGDPTSSQHAEQLPTYNAYSIDGDVTGPLVFVNYGVPADYEELERRGISVKGAIVIAKYGGSWRGIKPKVAAEHGAIGCLIYSDPGDDGYARWRCLPERPDASAAGRATRQRRGHADVSGRSAHAGRWRDEGCEALAVNEAPTLTKIPVLPISYGDAQPLLAALGGPVVPSSWRGGLRSRTASARVPHACISAQVRLGPQDAVRRHRKAPRNDRSRPMGHSRQSSRRLGEWRRGSDLGTGGRARGSARAWRAVQAGLAAEAHDHLRGLGRRGARPARLDRVGGGARRLTRRARRRVSQQRHERSRLPRLEGSHSLETFINGVAKDITDPETNVSSWKRNQAAIEWPVGDAEARAGDDQRIGALARAPTSRRSCSIWASRR